jgi:uncharacterized membrane protein
MNKTAAAVKAICKKIYPYRFTVIFIVFCILALLYAVKTGKIINEAKIDVFAKNIILAFYIFAIICISAVTGFVFFYAQSLKYEKQFALMFIVYGMIYLAAMPTWSAPDTYAHWLRLFDIGQGHIVSAINPETKEGGQYLPEDILPDMDTTKYNYTAFTADYHKHMDKSQLVWYSFSSSALYSPVTYSFQLPGFLLASIFTDRPFVISYAARFSAFILSFILLYFSIKLIPVKKMTLLLLVLTPMFLQEATSLAGDALINTIAFAATAISLYYTTETIIKLTWKNLLIMALLAIPIALGKVVYLPLIALFFIIPKSKYTSKKSRYIFLMVLSITAIGLNIIWLNYARQFLVKFKDYVDSPAQIRYMLSHPVTFILIVFKTYLSNMIPYVLTFIGSSLGWLHIPVAKGIIALYALFILLLAIMENTEFAGNNPKRRISWYLFSVLAVLILIAAGLYVQWTRPGSLGVLGIQGRYLIPVSLAFILCIPNIIYSQTVIYPKEKISVSRTESGFMFDLNNIKRVIKTDTVYRAGLILVAYVSIRAISAVIKAYV